MISCFTFWTHCMLTNTICAVIAIFFKLSFICRIKTFFTYRLYHNIICLTSFNSIYVYFVDLRIEGKLMDKNIKKLCFLESWTLYVYCFNISNRFFNSYPYCQLVQLWIIVEWTNHFLLYLDKNFSVSSLTLSMSAIEETDKHKMLLLYGNVIIVIFFCFVSM